MIWVIVITSIVLLSVLLIVLNQILIRKFYWGPSGQPPRYRSHEKSEEKHSPENS